MGEMRNVYKILVRKPERRRLLEWIFGKEGWKVWTGCLWLRIGPSGGLL
jgi:hypothetical protein